MRTSSLLILAVVASVAAGCGGSTTGAPPRTDADERPAPATTRPRESTPPSCGEPPAMRRTGELVDAVAARREVDAAAARRTRAGSRFELQVAASIASLPTATATLAGRRLPANTSAAALSWSGAARALLPGGELRIVDDQLLLRRAGARSWRQLGSASGVSLDVGRELLDHPFLLDVADARRTGTSLTVAYVAPAARLRSYSTSERRGPVTELLGAARSLRIVVHVRDGALLGDRFSLVSTVPASLSPSLGGRSIVIRGSSGYCALRAVDRAPIAAP